jgi:hypothetical protein
MGIGAVMSTNPVMDLPLGEVVKPEIALSLQYVLDIYTVGNLLKAWRNSKNHRSIEELFDTPEQARNCVAICAHWLGVRTLATTKPVDGWWRNDEMPSVSA